jgi:hypothetical protein
MGKGCEGAGAPSCTPAITADSGTKITRGGASKGDVIPGLQPTPVRLRIPATSANGLDQRAGNWLGNANVRPVIVEGDHHAGIPRIDQIASPRVSQTPCNRSHRESGSSLRITEYPHMPQSA